MARECGAGAGPCGGFSRSRFAGSAALTRPLLILALGLMVQGFCVSDGRAQTATTRPEAPAAPASGDEVRPADRDSLMTEIQDYTEMIRALRDSLSGGRNGLSLTPAQREQIEGHIADISGVIERISNELSRMEFEIKDNRISLVNEAGEGIVINVPEDLDDQVSQGIKALTEVILSELPDSVDFDHAQKWDWKSFRPEPPAPERRIIKGNIVKVWQNVHISAKEDVRGNVVVVFGDAEVSGRVDGSVITVFGNLLLDADAEVTGSVVAAAGYLDQDPDAKVDDVIAIDPLRRGRGEGWIGLFNHDGLSFLISQGMFLLMVLLSVVAVLVTPRRRFEAVTGTLAGAPLASLGLGVVVSIGGHAMVAILIAVLVLTVIGVPLALLVALLLLVITVVAVAVCGAAIGDRVCRLASGRCQAPWLRVVGGMVVLHLVSFLGSVLGLFGTPHVLASVLVVIGLLIKFVAYVAGLGALVNSRFGTRAAPSDSA